MLEARRAGPAATSSRESDEQLGATTLVRAFEAMLQTAYTMPRIISVPSSHRRRGIRRYWHSLPRPRLLLVFFIVDHARSSLERARRRLLAAAALGAATAADDTDRRCVTQYIESLGTHRRALYSTLLVLLTIVTTRLVLLVVPGAATAFGGEGTAEQMRQIEDLLRAFGSVSADLASVDAFFNALRDSPLETVTFVATSLMTVLYFELRLFVPAFRLKRAMFNLYPEPQAVSTTPARWSVQRASGLYDTERSVLAQLGAPARPEVPFDLIVPALLMPALLYFGWLAIEDGRYSLQPGQPLLSYSIAAAAIAGALARLGWLLRAWRRRIRPRDGRLYLPSEVRIRGSELVVALRDPKTILFATAVGGMCCIGIGLADVAARGGGVIAVVQNVRFLALVFVIAPLWYRMNRDVSAYLAARGAPRPGHPVLSLLAMAVGWFAANTLITLLATAIVAASVYDTCARVRRVEQVAGEGTRTLLPPVLLVPAFVIFPLVLAHVQHALNIAWRHDGDVLD